MITFDTSPDRYRHWKLTVEPPMATLTHDADEDGGVSPDDQRILARIDVGVVPCEERGRIGGRGEAELKVEPMGVAGRQQPAAKPLQFGMFEHGRHEPPAKPLTALIFVPVCPTWHFLWRFFRRSERRCFHGCEAYLPNSSRCTSGSTRGSVPYPASAR